MATITISDLYLAEFENEVVALEDCDQVSIQGGAVLTTAAGVSTTAVNAVDLGQEYSKSGLHDTQGEWYSSM
jgi:hypothetical protein